MQAVPRQDSWDLELLCCWITGFTIQKLSNVLDHVRSDQHKLSMSLYCVLSKRKPRMLLSPCTLRLLLEIQLEGPSLGSFSPKQAVEAWWKDCKTVRRPNQGPRKEYAPQQAPEWVQSHLLLSKNQKVNCHFVFRCSNGMHGSVALSQLTTFLTTELCYSTV